VFCVDYKLTLSVDVVVDIGFTDDVDVVAVVVSVVSSGGDCGDSGAEDVIACVDDVEDSSITRIETTVLSSAEGSVVVGSSSSLTTAAGEEEDFIFTSGEEGRVEADLGLGDDPN